MQSSSSECPRVQLGLHFVVETACHKDSLTEVTPLGGWGGLVGGRGRNWERCGCLRTGFPESLLGALGLPWGCLVNSLKRSGASSEGDKHLTKPRFPTLSVSVTRPKAQQSSSFLP